MNDRVRSAYMNIVEKKALDGDQYRVTIAANERLRQPPELDFDGLSTKNYARNPVVMWAHDVVGRSPSGGLPIGRTSKLTKTERGKIVADFEFLADDPFAQRVKNAWDRGFLQAASISWMPIEGKPMEGGKWRDTRAELLEWSLVAVPADPDALRAAHRHMLTHVLEPEVEPWGAFHQRAGSETEVAALSGSQAPPPRGGTGEDELREVRDSVRALRATLWGAAVPGMAGGR